MVAESNARLDPNRPTSREHYYVQYGGMSMWWDPDTTDQRIIRNFIVRTIPLDTIYSLAVRHAIQNPRKHDFDFSLPALCGAFLEAWGQGNFTPRIIPANPDHKPSQRRRRQRPKQELIW